MRALVLVWCVACGSSPPAVARSVRASTVAPSASPPVADAVAPQVDSAGALATLTRARGHASREEWPKAIEALETGARLDPTNATILGELTWARLADRRIDAAGESAKAALALASTGTLRASLLFNAGRVAQARGDEAAAQQLYEQSLAVRPNGEVKRWLESIGVHDVHAPVPLSSGQADPFVRTDLAKCAIESRASLPGCLRSANNLKTSALADIGSGFVVATTSGGEESWCTNTESRLYLERAGKLELVGLLDPFACAQHRELQSKIANVTATGKRVGAVDTVWIAWSASRAGRAGVGDDMTTSESATTLVCVPSIKQRASVCAFRIPTYERTEYHNFGHDRPPESWQRAWSSYAIDIVGDRLHVSLREGNTVIRDPLGDYKP